MSKGIDYGHGNTNKDKTTGIRYGVINIGDLNEWAHESFEPDYGEPTCPRCGGSLEEWDCEKHDDYTNPRGCCDYACETCERSFDSSQVYSEEPLGHNLDDGEYVASMGSSDNDIFVIRSPYYTRAAYCSPCAPGACHLANPCTDGERTYCFGPDWFSKNRPCPYPVWSVKDDALVYPPTKEGLSLMLAANDGDELAGLALDDYLKETIQE